MRSFLLLLLFCAILHQCVSNAKRSSSSLSQTQINPIVGSGFFRLQWFGQDKQIPKEKKIERSFHNRMGVAKNSRNLKHGTETKDYGAHPNKPKKSPYHLDSASAPLNEKTHMLGITLKKALERMDQQVPKSILNPVKYFVAAGYRVVGLWDDRKRRNARDGQSPLPETLEMIKFTMDQMEKLNQGEEFKESDRVTELTLPSETLFEGFVMVKELAWRAFRCDEGAYQVSASKMINGILMSKMNQRTWKSDVCQLLTSHYDQIKHFSGRVTYNRLIT